MPTRHPLVLASLLLAGFAVSACTAILVPGDKDNVALCNTTEDCEDPDDNRHVAQCVYGEGQPDNSDKVCSSAFAEVNCNPEAYSGDSAFAETYEDATSNQNKPAYAQCVEANRGKRGCPASNGSCDSGLELIDGICDDPDALFPALNPSDVGGVELAGQDVLDQFCRYYFCDESFVCDTSGSTWSCKACDPDEEFGSGGCGTLYIQGEPAGPYTDAVESNGNCSGNKGAGEVEFGPATEPVPTP